MPPTASVVARYLHPYHLRQFLSSRPVLPDLGGGDSAHHHDIRRIIRRTSILVLCAGLLPLSSHGQVTSEATDQAPEWSFSASIMAYWLPDDDQFTSPTVSVDRAKLHLEARYNYESLDTASGWIGYNTSFGDTVSVDFTPMVGIVSGDISGIAPGYHLTVGWRAFEFYSEGEYVFDRDNRSDSYFYSWSEAAWYPLDWLRVGLVAQRTRLYQSDRDIQRGVLVGVALSSVSLGAYVFDPDTDDPTYTAALAVAF